MGSHARQGTGTQDISVPRQTLIKRYPILLVTLVCVAYANSFSGVFLLDDHRWIDQNPRIRSLWPITSVVENSNRPLGQYTFAINYAISGNETWSYHAFNLAIHLACALLLFGIVRRTLSQYVDCERLKSRSQSLAFAIASLWAIHPLQTQAVTYLIQRLESLMGLFFMLTLYSFIRADQQSRNKLWLGISVLSCAMGMATKEVMFAAPLIVLWYARAFVNSSWNQLRHEYGKYFLFVFATWGILFLSLTRVTNRYEGGIGNLSVTPWEYFKTQPEVICRYLRLCFWPTGQCLDYEWPVAKSLSQVALPGMFLIGVLFWTLSSVRRAPAWSFLGAWFFIILAPTSSFVPIADLAFEHRMYLPSIAVITSVVISFATQIPLPNESNSVGIAKAFSALLVLVLLALTIATIKRNPVYSSEKRMWDNVIANHPDNLRALTILADLAARKGDQKTRIQYVERLIRSNPDSVPAQQAYGELLLESGRFAEAKAIFEKILVTRPNEPTPLSNLAVCNMILGELALAEKQLQQALEADSYNITANHNYATLKRQAEPDVALKYYDKTLEIAPFHLEAAINRAGTLTQLDRPDMAMEQLEMVEGRATHLPVFFIERALTYLALGDERLARADFQAALKLSPGNPEVLYHLNRLKTQP